MGFHLYRNAHKGRNGLLRGNKKDLTTATEAESAIEVESVSREQEAPPRVKKIRPWDIACDYTQAERKGGIRWEGGSAGWSLTGPSGSTGVYRLAPSRVVCTAPAGQLKSHPMTAEEVAAEGAME
jgi:hypothetical protein